MCLDRRRFSVAIALLGVNMPLYAVDLGSDTFSLSGFGSLGVVHSSFEQGDFKTTGTVPRGAGRSDHWDFSQLSRVGVQLDAKLNDQWSSSVQAISEYNYHGNYSPQISNAFIKYQMTPDTAIRAGQFILPAYMLTEYAKIGYAQPWVRPPIEMYRFVSLFQGMDVTSKFRVGNLALSAQGFGGVGIFKAKPTPTAIQTDVDQKWTAGLNVLADYKAWTFRGSHIQLNFDPSPNIDGVLNQYRAAGLSELADRYDPNAGKISSYDSLSVMYDPGTWFFRSELARLSSRAELVGIPSYMTGYVSLGYRVGAFTPYYTYGKISRIGPSRLTEDTIGTMNARLASTAVDYHSSSIGVRWDFRKDMDLKVQFTRMTKDSANSTLSIGNVAPGATIPENNNVIFAGVDFVF